MIKVDEITGVAYWASYLINGDDSGIAVEEKALADKWLTLGKCLRRDFKRVCAMPATERLSSVKGSPDHGNC